MGLFKFKQADSVKKLEKALMGVEAPHFPGMVMRILQRIRDPEATMTEIAEGLQWDPGLVVRVLQTVNSAAYGPAHPIRDVGHAASYMGRSQLEQLVLSLAVKDTLPMKPAPGYDPGRFWFAASRRAALSRLIAGRLQPARQAECFTAGLLQDMAIPVLATARPNDYGPILSQWHEGGHKRLHSLEKDAFGWSHAEIGAMLGKIWELPDSLTDMILVHHDTDPTDDELPPAVRLVAVLRETEDGIEAMVELARSDYGLQPEWTLEAIEEANEQASELTKLIS